MGLLRLARSCIPSVMRVGPGWPLQASLGFTRFPNASSMISPIRQSVQIFCVGGNVDLLLGLQAQGAFNNQSMVEKEHILDRLHQRNKRLLLTAGDWNPCLGKRFFLLYVCATCRWGPIVQCAWYLVISPKATLRWHCANCGQRYRWRQGAPYRALVLCWEDAAGEKFVQMWRLGNVSKETDADIVILRALVLYNTIENTTVQAILEGLKRLNGLALDVCEEYNVGEYWRTKPLHDLGQCLILDYDHRISLRPNTGSGFARSTSKASTLLMSSS